MAEDPIREPQFETGPEAQLLHQIREQRFKIKQFEGMLRKGDLVSSVLGTTISLEARLQKELRELRVAAALVAVEEAEEATDDEIVAEIRAALQDLPTHLIDELGEVVDELRNVTPRPLRVVD